jgi:hypothetical protein
MYNLSIEAAEPCVRNFLVMNHSIMRERIDSKLFSWNQT